MKKYAYNHFCVCSCQVCGCKIGICVCMYVYIYIKMQTKTCMSLALMSMSLTGDTRRMFSGFRSFAVGKRLVSILTCSNLWWSLDASHPCRACTQGPPICRVGTRSRRLNKGGGCPSPGLQNLLDDASSLRRLPSRSRASACSASAEKLGPVAFRGYNCCNTRLCLVSTTRHQAIEELAA